MTLKHLLDQTIHDDVGPNQWLPPWWESTGARLAVSPAKKPPSSRPPHTGSYRDSNEGPPKDHKVADSGEGTKQT